MIQRSTQKIVIIGCGNLAWHLAKHLAQQNNLELFVYNHKYNKKLNAFKRIGCTVYNDLSQIITDASYYFICVADKFISSVSEKINAQRSESLIIHSSGSIDIKQIKHPGAGVFYPLQTFTAGVTIDWKNIPVLIEATNTKHISKLRKLAEVFSKKIIVANSSDRLNLHLAAVLVSNFTNALYAAADEYLSAHTKNRNINFNLLLPLIEQTADKVKKIKPVKAQTGPAKRQDTEVMKRHLSLLTKDKELKTVYKQLSNLIADQQKRAHD